MKKKIAIIGAGIGGLTLANLLQNNSNFKNSISNKKLNINLYYKFSLKIPSDHQWFSLKRNNEFIPSFTKKILKQISTLF